MRQRFWKVVAVALFLGVGGALFTGITGVDLLTLPLIIPFLVGGVLVYAGIVALTLKGMSRRTQRRGWMIALLAPIFFLLFVVLR